MAFGAKAACDVAQQDGGIAAPALHEGTNNLSGFSHSERSPIPRKALSPDANSAPTMVSKMRTAYSLPKSSQMARRKGRGSRLIDFPSLLRGRRHAHSDRVPADLSP
jgi:hypothetical protein